MTLGLPHFVLACSALLTINQWSYAGPLELLWQKYLEESTPTVAPASIDKFYFSQLIDHANPSKGTFAQRYYVDETYGPENNAPVFFYICGESTCTTKSLSGAIRTYAKKYHAKLVALEHRYYGESLPLSSFSVSDLSYLSTEAALDDLAYFERYMKQEKQWKGKWVAFGGSYPGSLSAFYRLKFPYMVVGSLASSAPVKAKEDFIEYDTHVTQVTGPICTQHMLNVVNQVEAALDNPQELARLKALFEASDVEDPIDFLYLIADVGATAVQYGKKDAFCKELSSSLNPMDGYAKTAKLLFKTLGIKAVEMTAQGAMSENPKDYDMMVGARQWFYQSCTEYGYWQNANPDRSQSSRSALIDLNYHHHICKRLFNLDTPADTKGMNDTFYKHFSNEMVTHIYFTNGANDPWSTLSISEENRNAENPNLTYYTIANAAHCEDLHTPSASDSNELQHARVIMDGLLGEWLAKG